MVSVFRLTEKRLIEKQSGQRLSVLFIYQSFLFSFSSVFFFSLCFLYCCVFIVGSEGRIAINQAKAPHKQFNDLPFLGGISIAVHLRLNVFSSLFILFLARCCFVLEIHKIKILHIPAPWKTVP